MGADGFQNTGETILSWPQRFFSFLVFDTVATALYPLDRCTSHACTMDGGVYDDA